MIEYICAYCGKAVQVKYPSQLQKFCSKSCSSKWGNEQRYGTEEERKAKQRKRKARKRKARETIAIKVPAPETFECVFQPESILCDRQICSRCGWNPDVAKARLEAIMEKRNGDADTVEKFALLTV